MTSGHNVTDADMDCGGFFDHIDDFLDIPIDLDTFPGIGAEADRSPPEAFRPCTDSVFSGSSDISAELSMPYDDFVQKEWLSSFVEDSFSGSSGGITVDEPPKGSPGKHLSDHRFRTSSPVSVMGSSSSSSSSSSCSVVKTSIVTIVTSRCGRARSKRPRPKTINFQPITVPPPASGSETCAESHHVIKILKESNLEHKNKTKIKFALPAPTPTDGDLDSLLDPIRKCLHCEITKTPQWRAGPMGPKTLCNACGVRYKSGRLFPEYRPAASPTFVPTIHSNSHKKVLEIRKKVGGGRAVNGIVGGSAVIEQIPNARVAMVNCV